MELGDLIKLAVEARSRAYAPYSGFAVGAALLADNGEVFTGANVENISYGLTICAERAALVAAVSQGQKRFREIVVVSDSQVPVSPCGACRQVLAEFCDDLKITTVNLEGAKFEATLGELLPRAKTGILDRKFHVEQ